MNASRENYNYQRIVVLVGVSLFVIKMAAWWLTQSVAILTDALESTVNVVSGFIGLYSLYISAIPKDRNHPYGHGKVEFVSAGTEGLLISVAGAIIIYQATLSLFNPREISRLDFGILLVAITAVINYLVGILAIRKGKKNSSLALIASGKHLQSDTYSTVGIIVGLGLLYLTGWQWLDSVVALLFGSIIIYTGYKIIRDALSGIMDEADQQLLDKLVLLLQESRKADWIDLHSFRVSKYGGFLHFDCHLTLPWYFNLREAHAEIDHLRKLVKDRFGDSMELFVHTDPCRDFSCKICSKADCPVRISAFVTQLEWNVERIATNTQHHLQ